MGNQREMNTMATIHSDEIQKRMGGLTEAQFKAAAGQLNLDPSTDWIREEGETAHRTGVPLNHCPFWKDSVGWHLWRQGWKRSQDRVREMVETTHA